MGSSPAKRATNLQTELPKDPPHTTQHRPGSSPRGGLAQLVRASVLHTEGQRFESSIPHQMPTRVRLHPHPKRDSPVDCRYVCIIWIRLPQVSSKTAMVTLGNSVGSIVKATPSDFSFSYSARMSVTLKDAAGMPWSNIPF